MFKNIIKQRQRLLGHPITIMLWAVRFIKLRKPPEALLGFRGPRFWPIEQNSSTALPCYHTRQVPPTHHLHVRDGHVEVLREVGVPDEANVGQEHAPQVALVGREVPHALDLFQHFISNGPRSAYGTYSKWGTNRWRLLSNWVSVRVGMATA